MQTGGFGLQYLVDIQNCQSNFSFKYTGFDQSIRIDEKF